jgi:hypothetical protein
MKLELLTNATIVEDALKFVERNKDMKDSINNNTENKEDDTIQNIVI